MLVQFDLPDSAALLLRMSAARMKLATGEPQSCDRIAKAIVLEVLIDDAEAHGIVQTSASLS